MSESSGFFRNTIGMFLLWIASAAGWFYYIWLCFKLQIFGWLITGILLPPVAILIGIWSILFGLPSFMWPEGF